MNLYICMYICVCYMQTKCFYVLFTDLFRYLLKHFGGLFFVKFDGI